MKKILALILACLMLVALFAGCSNGSNTEKDPGTEKDPNTEKESGTESDTGDDTDDAEDIVEITFMGLADGTVKDTSGVEKAINVITEKEIGVHVNFKWATIPEYGTQLTLALTNKEPLDVALTYPMLDLVTLYNMGAVTDLTEYANAYGKDALDVLGDLISATTIDSKICSFPCFRVFANDNYIIARQDEMEACGTVDAFNNMKTWADLEAIFEKVKANGNMAAICDGAYTGGLINFPMLFSDNICETINKGPDYIGAKFNDLFYIDGEIKSSLYMDEYVAGLKMAANWSKAGYFWADSQTNTEGSTTLLGRGVAAITFDGGLFGYPNTVSAHVGVPTMTYKYCDGMAGYSDVTQFTLFVPVNSAYPEEAVKFINLLYTNSELMTTLAWGEKDVDYVEKDGMGYYPDGKEAADVNFHTLDFLYGNQFLILPWSDTSADFRTEAMAHVNATPVSRFVGLAVDASPIDQVITNISGVNAEYQKLIQDGGYTDELYAEWLGKLEVAGYADYMAFYANAVSDYLK